MGWDDYGDDQDYSSPYRSFGGSRLFSPYGGEAQAPDPYNYRFTPDWNAPSGKSNDESEDEDNDWDRIRKKYGIGQQGVHSQAYTDYLADQPKPEQYAPGKGRRIAALLGGVGQVMQGGDLRQGLQVQHSILDEPYNDALQQYKIRGDRLKQAADIEERDIKNRTYQAFDEMKFLQGQKKQALAEQKEQANEQYKFKRLAQLGTKKTFYVDPNNGHRMMSAVDENGVPQTVDLGKTGLSMKEQQDLIGQRQVGTYQREWDIRLPNEQQLIKDRAAAQRGLIGAREESAEKLMRAKEDYIKRYVFKEDKASGGVLGINRADPSDQIWTDLSGMNERDKAVFLNNLRIGLKAAPGPTPPEVTTETTKELGPDGKLHVVTRKTSKAAPAEPKAVTANYYDPETSTDLGKQTPKNVGDELWWNPKANAWGFISAKDAAKAKTLPGWKRAGVK